jgi:hypothetical protein
VNPTSDIAKEGTHTLFQAIGQMHPGTQVALLVLLGVLTLSMFLNWYMLRVIKEEREIGRQNDLAIRAILEKVTVVLAVVQDRIAR